MECNYTVDFKEVSQNKEQYAKEFSEGNAVLEQLLKKLWKDGFETIGCCGGHENSNPYIGFRISNIENLITLFSSLDKKDIGIYFVRNKDKINCSIAKFKEEDIFQNILNSSEKKEKDAFIETLFQKFVSIETDKYVNLKYQYLNHQIYHAYFTTNDETIIKKCKEKYKYIILNNNSNLYQFYIDGVNEFPF